MIGYLTGQICLVEKDSITVLLGSGIGYRVYLPQSLLDVNLDDPISLYIHTHVREDEIRLFGFESLAQRQMFELLISVSGVGPKMALGIIEHGSVEQIHQAVARADVGFFTKVSGIGKKNGQRIIVDLKSKIGSVADIDLSEPEPGNDEVYDALVTMGFEAKQVQRSLKEIDSNLSEQERIKLAIKKMSG